MRQSDLGDLCPSYHKKVARSLDMIMLEGWYGTSAVPNCELPACIDHPSWESVIRSDPPRATSVQQQADPARHTKQAEHDCSPCFHFCRCSVCNSFLKLYTAAPLSLSWRHRLFTPVVANWIPEKLSLLRFSFCSAENVDCSNATNISAVVPGKSLGILFAFRMGAIKKGEAAMPSRVS